MLCLTAFNPTPCSHCLSLPPSSLALLLLPSSFPTSVAWAGRPLWAQNPCSSSFLRTFVTFAISVFFTALHVLRKETASLTLFTIPKVMEALVEEAGSTYSPTHPLQHCTNWCSNCISSRIDPNTVIQDRPRDQKPGTRPTHSFQTKVSSGWVTQLSPSPLQGRKSPQHSFSGLSFH